MKKRKKSPPVEAKQSIEDGWAAADYARYGYVENAEVLEKEVASLRAVLAEILELYPYCPCVCGRGNYRLPGELAARGWAVIEDTER